MKKLIFATAMATVGFSSAFADVYNVKFSAKTPVDVANTKGEVTTSLKTVTVQGLWDMDAEKYVFWTVNGSVYTPIKNATLALVAKGEFVKKGELNKTQVAEEWELLWGEEGWGNDLTKLEGAFVASGLKKLTVNRTTGDIIPTSVSGSFAGQMFGKPAFGTWSMSKNTTATKNGIDAALPAKLTDREFGAAKEEELQAWKDALNSSDEDLTAAQEEIKKLNADMAALADELDAANVTIDVKAEEIKGLKESLDAAGAAYEALEGALAETNGVLAEAQANLEAANKSIEELEETLTATNSTLAEKVDALNRAHSDLEQAEKDLTALQKELYDTQKELGDTQKELGGTKDALADAEKALAKAEDALKQCGEKYKELEGKFDVLKLTYDTIVAAVKELDDVDSAKLISSFIAEQKKIMEKQKTSALAKKAQIEKDYLTYDQIITEVNDKKKAFDDAQADAAAKKAAYEAAKAAYDDKLVEVEILRALSNGLYRSGWHKKRLKIIKDNEDNIADAQVDFDTLIDGLEEKVDEAQKTYDTAYNRFYGNEPCQEAGRKVQELLKEREEAEDALEAFDPDSITVDTETFEEYIERTGADPEDAQTVLDWKGDYAKRLAEAQNEARAALKDALEDIKAELESAMGVYAYRVTFVQCKAELDAATAALQDAERALEEAEKRAEEGGDVAELIAGYQAKIDQAKAEIKRAEETVWSLEIQKAEEANLLELEKAMNDAKAAWDAAEAAVNAARAALEEIKTLYSTGNYAEDGAFGNPLAGDDGAAYTAARAEEIQKWQDIADNAQEKVDALDALTKAVFPAE